MGFSHDSLCTTFLSHVFYTSQCAVCMTKVSYLLAHVMWDSYHALIASVNGRRTSHHQWMQILSLTSLFIGLDFPDYLIGGFLLTMLSSAFSFNGQFPTN